MENDTSIELDILGQFSIIGSPSAGISYLMHTTECNWLEPITNGYRLLTIINAAIRHYTETHK